MANGKQVTVGSVWITRHGGEDVAVKVDQTVRKPSGHLDCKVRRVGADGQAYGRSFTKGSASLRPADVSASVPPAPPPTPAPLPLPQKPRRQPPRRQLAKPSEHASVPPPPPAPRASAFFTPPPNKPAGLPSLRGQPRPRPAKPAPKPAPKAQAATPARIKPEYPSKLVEDLCKALMRTDGTEWQIRQTVSQVLAEHNTRMFSIPRSF